MACRGSCRVSGPSLLVLGILGVFLMLVGAGNARADDLSGCWKGCWQDCSGHHGPLQAVFCKCDECHYRVTFTGRFFKVFPFRYTVVLNVVGQEGDQVVLVGETYLGRLFGTFRYSAEATATDFVAHYSSCRYQGKFLLKRCRQSV